MIKLISKTYNNIEIIKLVTILIIILLIEKKAYNENFTEKNYLLHNSIFYSSSYIYLFEERLKWYSNIE